MYSPSAQLFARSLAAADSVIASKSFLQRTVEAAKVFEQARIAQAEEDREEHLRDREERDSRSSTGRLQNTDPIPLRVLGYRDDKAADLRARERHYRSPAYRELHRKYIGTSGMGGFGGEKGFEFSPRMYVDPDRPHLKSVYNITPILSNLRYARFGHFIKELHMIDIDKMYRHARMVPTPTKLLSLMVNNRVPLTDRSCGALIRQQGRLIRDMPSGRLRMTVLAETKELFERLLLQNLPPADVGVITHAEFIKCCALAKDWSMGWDVLHQRAVGLMEASPEDFMLTSDYFEAVMQLCVSCYKVEEGVATFEQILAINLRPTQATLDMAMDLLAQSATVKMDDAFDDASLGDGVYGTAARTSVTGTSLDIGDDVAANGRRFVDTANEAVMAGSSNSLMADAAVALPAQSLEAILERADELWALYEYFDYKPDKRSMLSYVKVAAGLGQGDRVLLALEHARTADLILDEETYIWVLFGLRHLQGSTRIGMDVVAKAKAEGFAVTAPHHQAVLMGAALQGDGEGALAYVEDYILPTITTFSYREGGLLDDLTFEMMLYAMLAMAHGEGSVAALRGPSAAATESIVRGLGAPVASSCAAAGGGGLASTAPARMVAAAGHMLKFMETSHSAFDIKNCFYECYFKLCGWAGESVTEAHSILKRVLAEGCDITPRMLNHVLLANANSPTTGSRLITEEIAQMLNVIPNLTATAETFVALDACKEAHGMTERTDALWDMLLGKAITIGQAELSPEDRVQPMADGSAPQEDDQTRKLLESIESDAPINIPFCPVHAMRKHAVAVHLRTDDIHLKRHGQFSRRPKEHARVAYGSMTGSTKMFNHKGSEAMV